MKSNLLFLQVGVRWWANRLLPLLLCPITGKQSKKTTTNDPIIMGGEDE